MWSEMLLGIFLQGFICQTQAQEPQIVPYICIFCFDSGPAYQFVKCEGKIGVSPSAAAVMEWETRNYFLP